MNAIKIDTKKFAPLLRMLGKVVPNKSSLPILEMVFFEEDEGRLKLSATSIDIHIILKTDIPWSKEFEVAVPYKQLAKVFRTSRARDAFITVHEETGTKEKRRMTIKGGNSSVKHYTVTGDQRLFTWANQAGTFTIRGKFNWRDKTKDKFTWEEERVKVPNSQELAERKEWTLIMKNSVDTLLAAAAPDGYQPVLQGLTFDIKGSRIFAADGFKLGLSTDLIEQELYRADDAGKYFPTYTVPSPVFKIIPPSIQKSFLVSFFQGPDGGVPEESKYDRAKRMSIGALVKIQSDDRDITIISQVLVGGAPDFDQIIKPAMKDTISGGEVIINKVNITSDDLAALIGACEVARKDFPLMFHDGEHYAFDTKIHGCDTKVIVNLSFGMGGQIALNPWYVRKALAHLLNGKPSVETTIYYKSWSSPIVFENCDRLFIVMPMRSQGAEANHFMTETAENMLAHVRRMEEVHANPS